MVPARIKTHYIIRFTVTSYHTTEADIERDWRIIQQTASKVTREVAFAATGGDEFLLSASTSPSSRLMNASSSSCSSLASDQQEEIPPSRCFQSSLLLSNVPQTPKVVNASFLAFFPDMELTMDIVKELTKRDYTMSHFPLKPRRKLKSKSSRLGASFDGHSERKRWSSFSSSLQPPSTDLVVSSVNKINYINSNNNNNNNKIKNGSFKHTNSNINRQNKNKKNCEDFNFNELKISNGEDSVRECKKNPK